MERCVEGVVKVGACGGRSEGRGVCGGSSDGSGVVRE